MAYPSRQNKIYTAYVLTFLAVIIGIYARFKGLGAAPITGDEYHTAQSVRNILQHGIPEFECGGYYLRGVLLQYILAASSFIPYMTEETAYRSVISIFNLAAIPPLFFLAKRTGGTVLGLAAIIFFSLSIWEIENARYIRMYAPFQTFFLWYLYVLYRVVIEQHERLYIYLWGLSLSSILIYETGIFLCVLNFIPYLSSSRNSNTQYKIKSICISFVILGIAILFILTKWRTISAQPPLSSDINLFIQSLALNTISLPQSIGPLILPKNILFPFLINSSGYWLFGFICLLALSIATLWKVRHLAFSHLYYFIAISSSLLLSLLNQYSLITLTLLTLWSTNLIRLKDCDYQTRLIFITYISISFIFWVCFCLMTTEWHTTLFQSDSGNHLFKAMVSMFKYPNIYTKVLLQWLYGQPITTTIFLSAICIGFLIALIKRNISPQEKFFYSIVILLLTLTALLKQPYFASRYTFFIYPVILLLALRGLQRSASLFKKMRYMIFTCLFSITLYFSEDIDINHIQTIDTVQTIFRLGYSPARSKHLWDRLDISSPSEFVNENIKKDDIVLSTVRPTHYYLNQLNFYYKNKHNIEFLVSSACESRKEIWTGADFIYTEDELLSLLSRRKQNVWLITHNQNTRLSSAIEKKLNLDYKDDLVFKSRDNKISVFLLKANTTPEIP
tara:strand:+ start:1135 stop:3159 length:2025 start_codon:yes stop_codon:yes gene_type:complete